MADLTFTISDASQWNSLFNDQVIPALSNGRSVEVKQTADLIFLGEVSWPELSVDPSVPAENFTYDGQGHTIWLKSANLIDLYFPTLSEDTSKWVISSSDTYTHSYSSQIDTRIISKSSTFSASIIVELDNPFTSMQPFTAGVLYNSGTPTAYRCTIRGQDNSELFSSPTLNYITASYWRPTVESFQFFTERNRIKLVHGVMPSSSHSIARPYLGLQSAYQTKTIGSHTVFSYGATGLSIFGHLRNSAIKNLHLKWVNFGYERNYGMFAGVLARSLENCTVSNIVFEGCQTPYGFYSGLVAGLVKDSKIEYVKVNDSHVFRATPNLYHQPIIVGMPSSGGLAGVVIPDIEITDCELHVALRTFSYGNVPQAGKLGGLIGTVVKNGGTVKIHRVVSDPTFVDAGTSSITDSVIAKYI